MINGLFHRIAQNQNLLSSVDNINKSIDDSAEQGSCASQNSAGIHSGFFPGVSPNPFILGGHQLFLTAPPPGVQLMTIPVSLAAIPGSNQIPVIATSTGQFILANVASLPSASSTSAPVNPLFGHQHNLQTLQSAVMHLETQHQRADEESSPCSDLPPCTPSNKDSQQKSERERASSPVSLMSDDSGTKNTVNQLADANTVDGVDLEEVREFARQFKIRRLSLGLTQTQVGMALSAAEGPAYSQSAICRFEKLDITPRSASKIKPVLETWMAEAEEKFRNGSARDLQDNNTSDASKKRKRRTSFTPNALELLNEYFEKNTHPSGNEMTRLAESLRYDREVIRVWFCNRRQALKNTIKRLKPNLPEKDSAPPPTMSYSHLRVPSLTILSQKI